MAESSESESSVEVTSDGQVVWVDAGDRGSARFGARGWEVGDRSGVGPARIDDWYEWRTRVHRAFGLWVAEERRPVWLPGLPSA